LLNIRRDIEVGYLPRRARFFLRGSDGGEHEKSGKNSRGDFHIGNYFDL
jgi:hypothetical protein